MIYWLLYWEFFKVSIFCVGGGYASMPLIQNAIVTTYHWLTLNQFIDIFTISQMTPGPIGINAATFAGIKIAGLPGAVAATLGFVTPSFFLGIILAKLYFRYGSIAAIRGILNGLRPAVVGLILAAAISFLTLALWHTETLPQDLLTADKFSLLLLIFAVAAHRKGIGAVKLLLLCGLISLTAGLI